MTDLARRQSHATAGALIEEALDAIRDKAGAIRFGTITLTLHEGRVTQLEISEKKRFQS